jgi:transposase
VTPFCVASHYSGLTLASRIGPIERFPRPRSLANYFGLTPGCRNSGNAQDRLGSITKQGSKTARFILGQLVVHLLKCDPKMRDWYRKIKHRRGSKIARVAVMRRITTIFWHMLTYKEAYTLGGPPPRLRREENLIDARGGTAA